MATDIEYKVMIAYASGGTLAPDLHKAEGHAGHLKESLREASRAAAEVGSELVHGFQHAVEHAAHLASHLAKVGLAAGIGAATYGVAHLNNELEQTQISMAAIFKGQGFAGTFNRAFDMAGDQITKMKQDIKSLPGDLGQLSNVMLQLSSPLAGAGQTPDQIRKLAGQTMLASQILLGSKYGSAAQEIGAREMVMLLQGNMSARNTWAMEMPGMQQYRGKWKGMTEEQRLAVIQTKLNNLVNDAHDKFATSFVSMWTTFKDNMKYAFLAPATMPLFNAVKHSLAEINKWFDDNKLWVGRWAQQIGDALAEAWDRGISLAKEWGPTIVDFARQMHRELSVIWDRFAPAMKEVGDALRSALSNGTALKDIERILELYAVSKVAAGGSKVGRGIGMAAGAAIGGTAGAGVGGELGSIGGVGSLFGGPGVLAQKGFEVGLVGAMKDKPAETAKAMTDLARETQKLTDEFDVTVMPVLEKFALNNVKFAAAALRDFNEHVASASESINSLALHAETAAEKFGKFGHAIANEIEKLHPVAKMNPDDRVTVDRSQILTGFAHAMGSTVLAQNAEAAAREAAKRGAGRGGGGTHIQKVEIVVSTTQDANRVAEMVADKLQKIQRHPKVSQHAPNYTR